MAGPDSSHKLHGFCLQVKAKNEVLVASWKDAATPYFIFPNCANVPPGKIEKIIIKGSPGFLHLYACADKKWNSPFS